MLKKIKKYKLILINEDGLDAKEINSTSFFLISFLSMCIILTFILVSFFSTDISNLISFKSISTHKANNEKLHLLISNQQKEIDVLKEDLRTISGRDENLRKLVKLPPIDSDVRKLGVGGSPNEDQFNDIEYLLPNDIDLNIIKNSLDFLKRGMNLENLSYSEIEVEAKNKIDEILHYPAIYPVLLENCKLSSRFGYRIDPFTKKRKLHEGHDFSAKVGEKVICTANGTVKSSKRYGSFGNFIEIDHGNGYTTVYGHLSKRLVNRGEKVERGQIIATIGNTGKSTAPHLHYEIKHNKKRLDPSDFYYDLTDSK